VINQTSRAAEIEFHIGGNQRLNLVGTGLYSKDHLGHYLQHGEPSRDDNNKSPKCGPVEILEVSSCHFWERREAIGMLGEDILI